MDGRASHGEAMSETNGDGHEPLLTRDEVAKELRVSVRTLDRIVADGELLAGRIGGPRRGRVVFRSSDVAAYRHKVFSDAAR